MDRGKPIETVEGVEVDVCVYAFFRQSFLIAVFPKGSDKHVGSMVEKKYPARSQLVTLAETPLASHRLVALLLQ